MRKLVMTLVLLAAACGSDDSSSGGNGTAVDGLWAWCDDASCASLDDGGLFFRGGRVLDASYDAEAATYCTYEEVGTYVVQGSMVVITSAGDGGAGENQTFTISGSVLSGSEVLKHVEATAAASSTCPN